jgi:hypothetical protein
VQYALAPLAGDTSSMQPATSLSSFLPILTFELAIVRSSSIRMTHRSNLTSPADGRPSLSGSDLASAFPIGRFHADS